FGDATVVDHRVELVGGDAGRHCGTNGVEHPPSRPARGAQTVDRSGIGERLEHAARRPAAVVDIRRTGNPPGHRPRRADPSRAHRLPCHRHGPIVAAIGAHDDGWPAPVHAADGSGACGAPAYASTNCCTRGSFTACTSRRCSHATSTTGASRPAYGDTITLGCLASACSVSRSVPLIAGSCAIHTAPCSREWTAYSSGGCWS